ncbi:MAG TPA: hypothetical protein VJU61_02700 [Polyangiaceae bacterium]|nr:hypothetical protein [Polyangiaceae bacterium]
MPITGRTPAECFNVFRDHLGPVLAATLGPEYPVLWRSDGKDSKKSSLALVPANSAAGVKLTSDSYRALFFSMRQNLEVVEARDRKLWQLKTLGYKYAIYESDGDLAEPVLRWEYASHVPQGKKWCRHHFQVGRIESRAIAVPFGDASLDLNRLHTPTGFVLIEYVLRFLLTELGVRPSTDDWEDVLEQSQEKFFKDFSGRTS